MPSGLNIDRLKGKLHAARTQFNDMDIADIPAALQVISLDEATAIIEEIAEAKPSIPGAGLFAGATPVTGTSITGDLS